MPDATLISCFQIVTAVGSTVVAGKLIATGLYHRYRMFLLLCLFQIPDSLWPLFVNVRAGVYEKIWMATEPVTWLLYILVVRELYRLIFDRHKGLDTVGRWMMYAATGVSIAVSVVALLPRLTASMPKHSRTLGYFFAAQRGIYSVLVLFILLMILFLSRYPVRLSRNMLVHAALCSFFFFCGTFGVLLRGLFGMQLAEKVNLFLAGMSSLCVLAWFFLLTRKGEETQTHPPTFGPEYEARALRQLEAINATLLQLSRR